MRRPPRPPPRAVLEDLGGGEGDEGDKTDRGRLEQRAAEIPGGYRTRLGEHASVAFKLRPKPGGHSRPPSSAAASAIVVVVESPAFKHGGARRAVVGCSRWTSVCKAVRAPHAASASASSLPLLRLPLRARSDWRVARPRSTSSNITIKSGNINRITPPPLRAAGPRVLTAGHLARLPRLSLSPRRKYSAPSNRPRLIAQRAAFLVQSQ